MSNEQLIKIKNALADLENPYAFDPSTLGVLMEALASALYDAIPAEKRTSPTFSQPDPPELKELFRYLPFTSRRIRNKLVEICDDIEEAIRAERYDDGETEDDDDESIDYLIEDFCVTFAEELKKWETAANG